MRFRSTVLLPVPAVGAVRRTAEGYVSAVPGAELRLGTQYDRALALDRGARERLSRGSTLAEAQRWVDGQLGNLASATFGDLVRVHLATETKLHRTTAGRTRHWFLLTGEAVLARRLVRPAPAPGRRRFVEDFAVASHPVTLIDADFVPDYLATVHWPRRRQEKCAERLAHVRRMFTPPLLAAYRVAGLDVPDLRPFLQCEMPPRRDRPPVPEDRIRAVHAELEILAQGPDRRLFLTLALLVHAGLRRADIAGLQRDALQQSTGPAIALRRRNDFSPKKGHERLVPIPGWLYSALVDELDQTGSLIPGPRSTRFLYLSLVARWLREKFDLGPHPLHAIRAMYAAYLITTVHSIPDLLSRLGHRALQTTLQSYARHPLSAEVALLWERSPSVGVGMPGRSQVVTSTVT